MERNGNEALASSFGEIVEKKYSDGGLSTLWCIAMPSELEDFKAWISANGLTSYQVASNVAVLTDLTGEYVTELFKLGVCNMIIRKGEDQFSDNAMYNNWLEVIQPYIVGVLQNGLDVEPFVLDLLFNNTTDVSKNIMGQLPVVREHVATYINKVLSSVGEDSAETSDSISNEEAEVLKAKLEELNNQLSEKDNLIAQKDGRVGELETQIEELNSQVNNLTQQLSDLNNTIAELDKEKESLTAELAPYKVESSSEDDKVTIENLTNEKHVLNKTIARIEEDNNRLYAEAEELEKAIEDGRFLVQELESELDSIKTSNAKDVAEKEARISELEAQLAEANSSEDNSELVSELQSKKETLESELAESKKTFEEQLNEIKNTNEVLESKNTELQGKITELETKVNEASNNSAEVNELMEKISTLEADKQELETKISEEKSKVEEDSKISGETIASLEGKIAELEGTIAEMKENAEEQLEIARLEIQEQLNEAIASKEALTSERDELREKLEDMTVGGGSGDDVQLSLNKANRKIRDLEAIMKEMENPTVVETMSSPIKVVDTLFGKPNVDPKERIELLEEEVAKLNKTIADKEGIIATLSKDTDEESLKAENAKLVARVAELEKSLADLNTVSA